MVYSKHQETVKRKYIFVHWSWQNFEHWFGKVSLRVIFYGQHILDAWIGRSSWVIIFLWAYFKPLVKLRSTIMLLSFYKQNICDKKLIPMYAYIEHTAEYPFKQVFLGFTYPLNVLIIYLFYIFYFFIQSL